jgi:hypothetical protein
MEPDGTRAAAPRWSLQPHPFAPFGCREPAMSVLISVLITFVVVILVLYLVNILPVDGRTKQIVRVVVIIIGIVALLRDLAVF